MSYTGVARVRGPFRRVDTQGSDFELSAPTFTCEALHALKDAFSKDASKKQEWSAWLLPQVEALKVSKGTVLPYSLPLSSGPVEPPVDDLPRKLLALCHDVEEHVGISFIWTSYPRAPGEGVKTEDLLLGLFRWCLRSGRCATCRDAGDHPVVHWAAIDQLGLPHGCSSDLAPRIAKALYSRREDLIESAPEVQKFSLQQRESWSSVMAATCLRIFAHVLEDKKTNWRCTLVLDYILEAAIKTFNRGRIRDPPLLDYYPRAGGRIWLEANRGEGSYYWS